jgi:hypothetical protein
MKTRFASPHDAAAAEIVRQRWVTQPCSNINDGLNRTVKAHSIIRTLCEPFDDGNLNMYNDYVPNTSSLGSSLWPLLSKASMSRLKLQATVSQIPISKCHPGTNFNEALQNAVDTYSQLISWSSSVPSEWTFNIFTLLQDHGSDETQFALKQIHAFRNIQLAALWMIYWCGCIHLVQSLIEGYHIFRTGYACQSDYNGPVMSERSLRDSLSTFVDKICSSAPYLLGDVDNNGEVKIGAESKGLGAFFLLRGLRTANSVDSLSLYQRHLILDYLDRIGSAFGIKSASHARTRWLASHPAEAELLETL